MKWYYLLFIWFSVINLTACKDTPDSEKEMHPPRSPEEDQRILDENLAHTNKVWDSLQGILNRENLKPEYRDSIRTLFFRNKTAQEKIYKEFIREYPDSEVSVNSLNAFKFTWGKGTTASLFRPLSQRLKDSEEGIIIEQYLEYHNSPQVNDLFTDFGLPNIKGETMVLSENLGHYTLLEFWASWCHGCRKKHPELIEVYKEYKKQGFTVIGVSGDHKESDWIKAIDEDNLPWLNLRDPKGRESVVQYKYGIHYLPANFLIGPQGKIIAKDVSIGQLSQVLQRLSSGDSINLP